MQTEKSGRPQAMIAMSGGVDSSVAAYLMQQAGYDCMGVTMKLYENEDAGVPRGHTCCTLDDVEDVPAAERRFPPRGHRCRLHPRRHPAEKA